MNKRELIKWLDLQQQKALSELEARYMEAVDREKELIISRSNIVELMMEFKELTSDWFDKYDKMIRDNPEIAYLANYSSTVVNSLSRLNINSAEGVKESLKEYMSNYNCKVISDMLNYKKRSQSLITQNYEATKNNVKLYSTAKEAIAYLEELGFEVPSSTTSNAPQLPAAPVDVRYLFVRSKSSNSEVIDSNG